MKSAFAALLAVAALSACEADEFVTWATVVEVQQAEAPKLPPELDLRDDDLRIPEVAWKLELRLDDGQTVSLERHGARRYEPGERVPLLRRHDGELLL